MEHVISLILGLCLGWYGHLMVLYKTQFNWVTWSPPKYVLPIIFSSYLISSTAHILEFKMTNKFFKTFLKFDWVTGSPPKFDTLMASWYPTYSSVPTVMEKQGKAWKTILSWKVMEKSWKMGQKSSHGNSKRSWKSHGISPLLIANHA